LRALTLVDNKAPHTVEHRKDDHGEQLQESKDVRSGPHVAGAVAIVRLPMFGSVAFMILVFVDRR
jgi:hypothetical protein